MDIEEDGVSGSNGNLCAPALYQCNSVTAASVQSWGIGPTKDTKAPRLCAADIVASAESGVWIGRKLAENKVVSLSQLRLRAMTLQRRNFQEQLGRHQLAQAKKTKFIDTGKLGIWTQKHDLLRTSENLASQRQPHVGRVTDLLALAEEVTSKKLAKTLNVQQLTESQLIEMKSQLYTDVSQCASRRPWSTGTLRTITSSSVIWSHGRSRELTPHELMKVLGFAENTDLSAIAVTQAKSLVGECMSVPCVAISLAALLLAADHLWMKPTAT
eukprot:6490864-Amphidinium_carterae.1